MAQILDGKKIAEDLKKNLRKEADDLKKSCGSPLILATIVIGDDAGSKIYAQAQKKLCDELNIKHICESLPSTVSLEEIGKCVTKLRSQQATGIIVNQPLPEPLNHANIVETYLHPKKDVECLHPENFSKFYSGYKGFAPCTSAAVIELLKHTNNVDLLGKEIVIIGYSRIIGKPLALMLDERATITTCHVGTSKKDLRRHVENADILITAVGKEGFKIPGEWIKNNAVIIDVATRKVKGKIVGDVDFKSAEKRASYITPVPGGVGPVTNVMLIKNLLYLYKKFIVI